MNVNSFEKFGSYGQEDVIFLLKDLSKVSLEGSAEDREKDIQSGQHYSETLPLEYNPPENYLQLFWETLHEYKEKVAFCVAVVAEQIYRNKGDKTVLVSLARAGTPIAILVKRYIEKKYNVSLPHYSISIIRDRGIDENAIVHILQKHRGYCLQFMDGWTGKGAISRELSKACTIFSQKYGVVLDDTLAVLADPGYCTNLYGTREDFLIPSACLNSTVSGLISRTVLNHLYISPLDFHGAKFYRELLPFDVSNQYIDIIASQFPNLIEQEIEEVRVKNQYNQMADFRGMEEVLRIQAEFNIDSTNYVKPGVGETTRVLLRRVPWKILMKDTESPYVHHIKMLAEERGVEVISYPNMSYTCCGLIKKVV
ncbi:cysteine protease StiP family protein [Bacillus sp. B1-b2]|uniref:cysteine protease StiP family protein n=1 Tax=Bacillus sp. B1-b2 TaxID=2653201 RepID=UPI00126215CE|nr:cysteine protease StiP family protein [Bacillus sp. B1-b2]KAB7673014.1 cysteine protease StiP family protein [Bacillus sp. B1-b2]